MWASVYIDQSKLIFDQSKIVNKLFLKVRSWLILTSFFKSSLTSLSLSLSPIRTRLHIKFLSFSSKIFARFSSLQAGMSKLPSLFHLFLVLHAFFHALKGYFRTMHKLGFLMYQAIFCEIDQWVLLLDCYIPDLWWLIWSIWSFVIN